MSRATYHRAYYRDTAPRRRKLARERDALRRNVAWLIDELYAAGILHSPYRLYAAQWRPDHRMADPMRGLVANC